MLKVNTRIFGLLKRRKIGQVPRERQGNWTTRCALVTDANLKENLNMGNKGNLKGPEGKRGGRGDTKAQGGGGGGDLGKPCKSIENAGEGNMDETKAKHGKRVQNGM